MQAWQAQAEKNNLDLIDKGACQLCGANTSGGIYECMQKAASITHRLDHDAGVKHMTIFLCVDAHALQHPEVHGRWNNHLHLSRLYLILKAQVRWQYKYTPVLSDIVNRYKKKHPQEIIEPPAAKQRGIMTVTGVEASDSEAQYIERVNEWACCVFDRYEQGNDASRSIAAAFQERIFA